MNPAIMLPQDNHT